MGKNHSLRKLVAVTLASASAMSFTSCSLFNKDKGGDGGEQTAGLAKVTNIKFEGKGGDLVWDEVQGATSYEYQIDGGNVESVETNELNIFDVVTSVATNSIKIRAVEGEKRSEFETFTFTCEKLPTPNKPYLVTDEESHEKIFTWDLVEKAFKYEVSINDKPYITYQTNEFKPTSSGTYHVKVRCKSYVKDTQKIVYLQSDVSEQSDSYTYLQGPVLSVGSMNTIEWFGEIEFEQYNIYINGEKTKENVTSPLNLVTGNEPIITKTGEYDIQIEAIKNGNSYWSNIQKEVGTSNINEHEIYSFDNRKFNYNVPSQTDPGWKVSDEQSHSEPYSLYIPQQTQVNVQKYASSGINDINFTKVTKMSYWAFVPEIPGYSKTTVKGINLPSIMYDGWPTGETPHARCISYCNEEEVPIGEWTKLTFDVENQYERTINFGPGAKLELDDKSTISVPLYLDDLCYDELDPEGLNYDQRLRYGWQLASHAWSGKAQKVASFGPEYANKLVEITMDICGTAESTGSIKLGLAKFDEEKKEVSDYLELDRSYISSTTYKQIKFKWMLDGNGDFITAIKEDRATADSNEAFSIYLKDITCEKVTTYADLGGTEVALEYNTLATYVAPLAIPVDAPAGSLVHLTMKAGVHTTSDYGELRLATGLWADNTPKFNVLANAAKLKTSNDWIDIDTNAIVLDAQSVNFGNGSEYLTKEYDCNYVLIYLHGAYKSYDDYFYYKDLTKDVIKENIYPTDGGIEVPLEENANSTYIAAKAIPVDAPAGSTVNLSMKVGVSTTSDYAEFRLADGLWSNNTPKFTVLKNNSEIKSETGWININTVAKVLDAASINFHNGTQGLTKTFSGNYVLVYLHGAYSSLADYFYYKDVNVTLTKSSTYGNDGGTLVNLEANANSTYVAPLAIPVEAPAGSEVNLTMKVGVCTTSDYADLRLATGMWANNTPKYTQLLNNATVKAADDWIDINTTAVVLNATTVNFHNGTQGLTKTFSGNYVLIYLFGAYNSIDDIFYYKDEVVTRIYKNAYDEDGGIEVPLEENASGTYVAPLMIETEAPAGSFVDLSMKVGVSTTSDYADLRVGTGIWSNNTPNYKALLNNASVKAADDWIDITVKAKVLNAATVNFHNGTQGLTKTYSGNYVLVYFAGAYNSANDYFYYKELSINPLDSFTNGTYKSDNVYYQSYCGLPVDSSKFNEGDNVSVSMDIMIDSSATLDANTRLYSLDKSAIAWGGGTYADGLAQKEIVSNSDLTSKQGTWMHVEFETKVYSYTTLGWGNANPQDVSGYGLCGMLCLLSYKGTSTAPAMIQNVEIEKLEMISMPNGVLKEGSYYQSYVGLPVDSTTFNEGDDVSVELDILIPSNVTTDDYTVAYALDKSTIKWGGGSWADGLVQTKILDKDNIAKDTWIHLTFDTKVYSYTTLQWGNTTSTDVSAAGLCVIVGMINFKNTASPATIKNVVITAK